MVVHQPFALEWIHVGRKPRVGFSRQIQQIKYEARELMVHSVIMDHVVKLPKKGEEGTEAVRDRRKGCRVHEL